MFCNSIDAHTFEPFTPSSQAKNLTNQRFGRLHVISIHNRKGQNIYWLCLCDCSRWVVVSSGRLLRTKGNPTRSCGCLGIEIRRAITFTHGFSKTPEHQAYYSALDRCRNVKSQAYKWYGERGIEFRFTTFEEFLAEIGTRPSSNHSLDRIDNDGHYEIGNVRWATRREQGMNRRYLCTLEWNGERGTYKKWATLLGISPRTLYGRIHQLKWSVEKAFTQPVAFQNRIDRFVSPPATSEIIEQRVQNGVCQIMALERELAKKEMK